MFIFPLQRKSSPFRRVKSEEYVVDPRLQDNSFEAKVSNISDTLFEGLLSSYLDIYDGICSV